MVETMNSKWLRSWELPPLLLLTDIWIHVMKAVHEHLHHQFDLTAFTDYVLREVKVEREASSRLKGLN
jgi:hypothetical protein